MKHGNMVQTREMCQTEKFAYIRQIKIGFGKPRTKWNRNQTFGTHLPIWNDSSVVHSNWEKRVGIKISDRSSIRHQYQLVKARDPQQLAQQRERHSNDGKERVERLDWFSVYHHHDRHLSMLKLVYLGCVKWKCVIGCFQEVKRWCWGCYGVGGWLSYDTDIFGLHRVWAHLTWHWKLRLYY